jgi:hypothetical protein
MVAAIDVEGWIPFLTFGGVGLLVVGFIILAYLMEKKRTEAMGRAAEELDFEFLPQGDNHYTIGELQRFTLCAQGHSKRLYNLMRGVANDLEVALFDYDYTIGAGKRQQTVSQTVVCFRLGRANLPAFSLKPQTFLHKAGQWFGYQDINFESHPKFSGKYLLRGADEAAIRELFTDDVLSWYEGAGNNLCTEGSRDLLLFHRQGKRIDPKDVRGLLEDGFAVLGLFQPAPDTPGGHPGG